MHTLLPIALLGLLVAIMNPSRAAEAAPAPLRLTIESPGRGAIQYRSGWRLSIAMTPSKPNGFSVVSTSNEPFPIVGEAAALLLRDRDGCPRVIDPNCPDIPGDELVVRFTPDEDLPFVPDEEGDPALRADLALPTARPVFSYQSPFPITVGPGIQPPALIPPGGPVFDILDGIGYGPNDDLPGLVLLSDTGVGQVLTADLGGPGAVTGFDPLPTPRARNLAGLMTDVAFDLRRTKNRTVVSTSLIVPPNLFAPLILIDQCTTSSGEPFCVLDDTSGEARVDGGPRQPYARVTVGTFDFATSISPNVIDVEIRAVVVAGTAPAFVDDCSADGEVTAEDLRCAGHELLSNEAVTTVRVGGLFIDCRENSPQVGPGPFIGPGRNVIFVDFDNIPIIGSLDCPSGSGRTTSPP